jgi:glycosyltransferase involved in cell wall biosynthesis
MKKEVLFVMNNLNCGGAEKALVSLLQSFDYSKYNVDLFLFKQEGLFLNQLPKEVHLLPEPVNYKYFDMSYKQMFLSSIKSLNFKTIIARTAIALYIKSEKIPAVKEQKIWKYLSFCISKLPKKYDCAIGYLEKTPNYFCVDKVDASVKIGYVHVDYRMMKLDTSIDKPYLKKMNSVITVSEECKLVLDEVFPEYFGKFHYIKNMVSIDAINHLSNYQINDMADGVSFVSLGRLTYQKAFEFAIEASAILMEKGVDFKWYILGDGGGRVELEQLIVKHNLQDIFILLGIKENPYPYIKKATFYIQTSRFEGKSVAIDEAKILRKPILVTNFSTAKDQIENGVNGLIVAMNPQAIADGIQEMLLDKKLCDTFVDNLSNEKLDTQDEIMKLYNLIEKI